jgi:hypothetical protein
MPRPGNGTGAFFSVRGLLFFGQEAAMIRKLSSGKYRIYSRHKDPKTGRRRNLGTFGSRAAAQKHEREIQGFKRRGKG